MTRWAIKFWWLLHKDLITEYRSRQIWPSMLLLGSVVVLAFSIQLQTLVDRERAAGGLLWLAIFFSSTVAVDRSFAAERDDGCLDGLMSYPVPAGMLYLQKLAGNMLAMICLEFLLVPLFVVLTGVPLLAHPWRLAAVLALGNAGLSAIGTFFGTLISGTSQRTNMLVLVVLPLVLPVLIAAAEATRLLMASEFGPEWLRWIQLMGAFAAIFITASLMLFDFAVEE